jgi:hypothetical protein
VVWTVVDGIEARAAALKLARQTVVDDPHHLLREVAAGDAGLVRDEDGEPARVVQKFDGLGRVGEDAVARRVVDVADLLGDRPVAVDEDRRPPLHRATSKRRARATTSEARA